MAKHKKSTASTHSVTHSCVIGFMNVCHLKNKVDDVSDFMAKHSVDFMCLAETFLDTSTPDGAVAIPGYKLMRRDRPSVGGGVAMYARANIRCNRRLDLESDGLELLYVETGSRRKRTILGCIYRPPSASGEYFDDLSGNLEHLQSKFPGSIVLTGDFNVDVSNPSSCKYSQLLNFCQNNSLVNSVTEPTRLGSRGSSSTIDLVLSHPGVVSDCKVLQTSVSDHFSLKFQVQVAAEHSKPVVREGRNLRRVNMESVAADLQSLDLDTFGCTSDDVDGLWQEWIDKVVLVLDRHAPSRKYHPKSAHNSCPPWKSPEYHDSVNARDRAHREWLSSPLDQALYDHFRRVRSNTKRMARRLKSTYYKRIFDASLRDSRKTWRLVKTLAGESAQTNDPEVNAKQLSIQFGGVVTDIGRPKELVVLHGPPAQDCMSTFKPVREQDVLKLLSRIDEHKASGSDSVPCRWLKNCAQVLAPSLTYLINQSLSHGKVASVLKIAHVRPLYKGGDRSVAKNYRPVSLLPVISKLLEKVVHSQLVAYLEGTQQYPVAQFAYRSCHSTEDAVTYAVDRYLEHRDCHEHTGIAMIDMSKAFDKVYHQTLIADLQKCGLASTVLNWFVSYLSNRKQQVVLNSGEKSSIVECTCGVPQGSVLGPILFSIYTSNVPDAVPSTAHVQMFADDIVVDVSSSDVSTVNVELSAAVSSLASHLRSRGLILNESKTQVLGIHSKAGHNLTLSVTCDGVPLTQSRTAKYLGIVLDDQLNWKAQVAAVVKKVSYRLLNLQRIRSHLPLQLSITLYNSLLVSNQLYGSNAHWSNLSVTLLDRLRRLDKRCLRFAAGVPSS